MSELENKNATDETTEISAEKNIIEVRRLIRQLRNELDNAPTIRSIKGDGNYCSMRRLDTNNLLNALDKLMPKIVADASDVLASHDAIIADAEKQANAKIQQATADAEKITAKANASMKESEARKNSIVQDAEKQIDVLKQKSAAMQNDAVARANAIIQDANAQAGRIIAKANQEALQKVSDEEVYRQAMEYADKVRTDAEDYAGSQYRQASEAIGTIFNQYGHEMENLLQEMARIQDQFVNNLSEHK